MKKFLSLCAALLLFVGFSTAQEIKFDSEKIDYGTIDKGADGVRNFKFTNTGNAPLLITAAKGSCGCTVPQYPKEPIMPGQTANIEVKYDTNRVGAFTKYVTLTTNAKNNTSPRLQISGEVKNAAPATPAKEQNFMNKG